MRGPGKGDERPTLWRFGIDYQNAVCLPAQSPGPCQTLKLE